MKPLFSIFTTICTLSSILAQNPDLKLLPDTSFQNEAEKTASWVVSTTFNSRVLSAGRDYGSAQFGIFPGVFYNHPSGLYAGLSGSIFGDSSLTYSQSNLSLGFGGAFTPNWHYGLSFAHTFFHPTEEGLLSNGVGASTDLSFGAFNLGTSFTAMLGEENGYRLNFFGSGYWALGQTGWASNLAFAPSLSTLFGTENIPFYTLPLTQFERATGTRWLDRLKNNTPPRPRQEQSKNVFGLMSINLALPLYYYAGNWTFSLSPNLVIPVPLPGETYGEDQNPSAFFSLSFSRQF